MDSFYDPSTPITLLCIAIAVHPALQLLWGKSLTYQPYFTKPHHNAVTHTNGGQKRVMWFCVFLSIRPNSRGSEYVFPRVNESASMAPGEFQSPALGWCKGRLADTAKHPYATHNERQWTKTNQPTKYGKGTCVASPLCATCPRTHRFNYSSLTESLIRGDLN